MIESGTLTLVCVDPEDTKIMLVRGDSQNHVGYMSLKSIGFSEAFQGIWDFITKITWFEENNNHEYIPNQTQGTYYLKPGYGYGIDVSQDCCWDIKNSQNSKLIQNDPRIYTISLHAGSNLISIPLEPEDTRPDIVLSGIEGKYDRISTSYNGIGWFSYEPNGNNKNLDRIMPGRGYWLDIREPAELKIQGKPPTDTSLLLKKGENLVGFCALEPKTLAECFGNNFDKVTSVKEYNVEKGWVEYNRGTGKQDLTHLRPGYGYEIKVTQYFYWNVIDPNQNLKEEIYILELQPGHSLISIPIKPEDSSLDAILGSYRGKCEKISTYYVDGGWHIDPALEDQAQLTEIVPGKGYWFSLLDEVKEPIQLKMRRKQSKSLL